jgi:hypothetical protein
MPPLPIEAYQVGWVCALPKELTAARAMLDEEYGEFKSQAAQYDNSYVLGRIHNHNVVLACLPVGVYGTVSATAVAINMVRTFTGIRCGLVVVIGGEFLTWAKEWTFALVIWLSANPTEPMAAWFNTT